MNIDLLIKMNNGIDEFFAAASSPQQAPKDIANHLRRYCEPRMRARMLECYEQHRFRSGVAVLQARPRAEAVKPAG